MSILSGHMVRVVVNIVDDDRQSKTTYKVSEESLSIAFLPSAIDHY